MTDTREALMLFKPVPEGYVYQAPNPWLFGRRRFFLVNEAQKTELLAAVTSQSQFALVTTFILTSLVLVGASVAAIIYLDPDGHHPIGIVVATIVLSLLSFYVAAVITAFAAARRVQPLLDRLTPTDQRITAADRRGIATQSIWLPSHLTLVASMMIICAMSFIRVAQRTGGNPADIFKDATTSTSAFMAFCFGFISIAMLIPALRAIRQGQLETVPAGQRVKRMRLPAFVLAIAIAAFGVVSYISHLETQAGITSSQHRERTAEITKRLDAMTQRVNKSTAATASLKTRVAANTARMATLIDKLNHPTVKCDTPASSECAQRASQEKQGIEADIAATSKEAGVLATEHAAIEKESADIKTELAAIQAALDANR